MTERDTDIEINSYDVKYKIIISNKEIERKEKIIFINTEKMRNLLYDNNVANYFMDFTYQIIPKKQKPYKLMTLTCVNDKDNISNICSLVCIVYEDYKSIYYALKYLHDIYNFNPKFMHIDYSKAERKALLQKNLFDSLPIIISCFFHFTQCLYRKMHYINLIKKKLTKRAFEILRNYEMICFTNPKYIDKYKNFLESKMENEKEKNLFKYLNNNWIKKTQKYIIIMTLYRRIIMNIQIKY